MNTFAIQAAHLPIQPTHYLTHKTLPYPKPGNTSPHSGNMLIHPGSIMYLGNTFAHPINTVPHPENITLPKQHICPGNTLLHPSNNLPYPDRHRQHISLNGNHITLLRQHTRKSTVFVHFWLYKWNNKPFGEIAFICVPFLWLFNSLKTKVLKHCVNLHVCVCVCVRQQQVTKFQMMSTQLFNNLLKIYEQLTPHAYWLEWIMCTI